MVKILQTDEFAAWLTRLHDSTARARVLLRIDRIASTGNMGDTKHVGHGVSELRINYGPGYRVYFARRGAAIILLLMGGDKSSQSKDIENAIILNRIYH